MKSYLNEEEPRITLNIFIVYQFFYYYIKYNKSYSHKSSCSIRKKIYSLIQYITTSQYIIMDA